MLAEEATRTVADSLGRSPIIGVVRTESLEAVKAGTAGAPEENIAHALMLARGDR
jgi:hypothetical protein